MMVGNKKLQWIGSLLCNAKSCEQMAHDHQLLGSEGCQETRMVSFLSRTPQLRKCENEVFW